MVVHFSNLKTSQDKFNFSGSLGYIMKHNLKRKSLVYLIINSNSYRNLETDS